MSLGVALGIQVLLESISDAVVWKPVELQILEVPVVVVAVVVEVAVVWGE